MEWSIGKSGCHCQRGKPAISLKCLKTGPTEKVTINCLCKVTLDLFIGAKNVWPCSKQLNRHSCLCPYNWFIYLLCYSTVGSYPMCLASFGHVRYQCQYVTSLVSNEMSNCLHTRYRSNLQRHCMVSAAIAWLMINWQQFNVMYNLCNKSNCFCYTVE